MLPGGVVASREMLPVSTGVTMLPPSRGGAMANKMTHQSRAELANAIRTRYRSATGEQKRKILDEFIAVTGYHEKSAIRVLNAEPIANGRQTRTRVSLYDEAARAALIVLWEASDRVCGKRLRALAIPAKKISERPQLIYAEPGKPVYHALTMVWPLVCRRLEGFPNITSAQLFDELCIQFPGRFHPKHVNRLAKRVKQWRQDARARATQIPPLQQQASRTRSWSAELHSSLG